MPVTSAERAAREELAYAYRICARLGWHEMIYNHITLRVPGEDGHFLINPFGLLYSEVTADNLVKIDVEGNSAGTSAHAVNRAGFIVHSAIHQSRDDRHAVIHSHTTAGQVVASLSDGLQDISLTSMFFGRAVGYHDFEGITLDASERVRLGASLGDHRVLILRNHGLLTCGRTLAEAFVLHYHLQRACEVQIAVLACNAAINRPSPEAAAKAALQFNAAETQAGESALLFDAMKRWVDASEGD
jgi:ribulose-5-phosphate 4-epimerase/fuculose-1-phosphate aldolase